MCGKFLFVLLVYSLKNFKNILRLLLTKMCTLFMHYCWWVTWVARCRESDLFEVEKKKFGEWIIVKIKRGGG